MIFWYFFLYSFIIILDQSTKYWMLINAKTFVINSFLTLEVQFNRGISWGLFHSDNDLFFYFITFIIFCFIACFLQHTFMRYRQGKNIIAEIGVVAGACSNLFDRIYYSGVVDFIMISWKQWIFPVFNIADIAIVLGLFFIVLEGINEK